MATTKATMMPLLLLLLLPAKVQTPEYRQSERPPRALARALPGHAPCEGYRGYRNVI